MQLELGLAGGLTSNKSATPLKVNDMFYLKNFKGIRNIGYHYETQGKGINGENLGFERYLAGSCKLNFLKAALLKDMGVLPFIHGNIALAPNRDAKGGNLRASAGIGMSSRFSGVVLECYYNPFVYSQKNEIRAEFQINIGID